MLRRRVAILAFCCLMVVSAGRADLITPLGNPTGPDIAGTLAAGQSKLAPIHAQDIAAAAISADVYRALDAQGYNDTNGWAISWHAMAGKIQLTSYGAYTERTLALSGGTTSIAAENVPGMGGAYIHLDYTRGAGSNDPTYNEMRWLQVISTNKPLDFGTANGTDGAFGDTLYLDNARTNTPGETRAADSPFYPLWAASDGTTFLDEPSRNLKSGASWVAEVYIAKWNPTTFGDVKKGGTIDIYDGVRWGFRLPVVPEPSTLVLLGVGLGLVVVLRPARRAKRYIGPSTGTLRQGGQRSDEGGHFKLRCDNS